MDAEQKIVNHWRRDLDPRDPESIEPLSIEEQEELERYIDARADRDARKAGHY